MSRAQHPRQTGGVGHLVDKISGRGREYEHWQIVQIIGPVVDVEFPGGHLPSIYNALKIRREVDGRSEEIYGGGRPAPGRIDRARRCHGSPPMA